MMIGVNNNQMQALVVVMLSLLLTVNCLQKVYEELCPTGVESRVVFSLDCSSDSVSVQVTWISNKYKPDFETTRIYIDCNYTDQYHRSTTYSSDWDPLSFTYSGESFERPFPINTTSSSLNYNCTVRGLLYDYKHDCWRYFSSENNKPWCFHGELPTTTTTTSSSFLNSNTTANNDISSPALSPTPSLYSPFSSILLSDDDPFMSPSSALLSTPSMSPVVEGPSSFTGTSSSTYSLTQKPSSPPPATVKISTLPISSSNIPSSHNKSVNVLASAMPSTYTPSSSSTPLNKPSISIPSSRNSPVNMSTSSSIPFTHVPSPSSTSINSLSILSSRNSTVNMASSSTSTLSSPLFSNPSTAAPSSTSTDARSSLQQLFYIIIPVGLVIAIALLISPLLCLFVVQKLKKTNSISAATEFDHTNFFLKNMDFNVTVQKHQQQLDSETTMGSVVTIVQSLEIFIPSDSSNSSRDDVSYHGTLAQRTEDIISGHNRTTPAPKDPFRKSSSLSNMPSIGTSVPLDSTSCTSLNSYLDTTTITYPTTTDTSSPLHCPVHIAKPHPLESTVIPYDNISLESCEPYSDDDGYNRSAVGSEGYVTEPPSSADYIEQLSPAACYHQTMYNAQVNDYVLQKKINNRFVYQSSPSSSGYQSSAGYITTDGAIA